MWQLVIIIAGGAYPCENTFHTQPSVQGINRIQCVAYYAPEEIPYAVYGSEGRCLVQAERLGSDRRYEAKCQRIKKGA